MKLTTHQLYVPLDTVLTVLDLMMAGKDSRCCQAKLLLYAAQSRFSPSTLSHIFPDSNSDIAFNQFFQLRSV